MAMSDVKCNIRIAEQTRRKQSMVSLLEVLLKLQQASDLNKSLK